MQRKHQCAIVVIEDDAPIREAIRDVLVDEGHSVITFGDGAEGLAFLQRADPLPALIVLDLMLPGLNGWDFRNARAAHPRLRQVPLIIMTALPQQHATTDVLLSDVVATLAKPLDLNELLDLVAQHCSQTTAPALQ